MSPRKREPKTQAARIAKATRQFFKPTERVCASMAQERVIACMPGHTAHRSYWNEGYAYGMAFRARERWREGDATTAFVEALRAFQRLRWSAELMADALRDQRKGYGSLRFEVLR